MNLRSSVKGQITRFDWQDYNIYRYHSIENSHQIKKNDGAILKLNCYEERCKFDTDSIYQFQLCLLTIKLKTFKINYRKYQILLS